MSHLKLLHNIIRVFREDVSSKLEFYAEELYEENAEAQMLIKYKINELEFEDEVLKKLEEEIEKCL